MRRRYADQPVNPRSRGAAPRTAPVRPSVQGNGTIRRWLARSCGALVVVMVAFGAIKLAAIWSAKPVAQVAIEGNFTYISREDVAAKIYQAIDAGFIHLDLRVIQAQLEAEAWVDSASVSRRWPDGLTVKIQEHQPIARWGTVGVLNQRGEVILLADNSEFTHLPVLSGPEAAAGSIMQQYQALARLFRNYKVNVSGLKVDETMSWTVLLENGLPMIIGRDQIMEKVDRFLLVYEEQLKARFTEVESIDVRYSNGVAVGWKAASVPAQASKLATPTAARNVI